MVHSAVKRQSYLLQSRTIVEVVEQDRPPSYETPYQEASTRSPKNLKDLLQTSLKYLSDMDLFNLIITRLSMAAPKKAPLYLTTLCIEGVHDFFRPNRPVTDSVLLSGLESPDAAARNPFGRMPITRRDSLRLGGKFNTPTSGKNSPALLTSLATLFSFLEPAELRNVIQKRIADSVEYRPIECFIEFLESGGDNVPVGRLQVMQNRAKARGNYKAKKTQKKMEAEQRQEESSFMPTAATRSPGGAEATSIYGVSTHDDSIPAVDSAHSLSDLELEDGEILPRLDLLDRGPLRSSTHPFSPFSSGSGAAVSVPPGNHIAGSSTAPPPKKKKRRPTKAARRAQREPQLRTSIATPHVVGPHVFPGHLMPSTSLAPMPGRSFTQFLAPTPGDPFHPDHRNILTL